MTPVQRDLIIYKGTTFTFFVILRNALTQVANFTVDPTSDVFTTVASHNLRVGDPVQFTNNGGALPVPVELNRQYWVVSVPSSNTFLISTDYAGDPLDILTPGTGTNAAWTNPPIDLTGWSVWAWVKDAPGGTLIFDLDPQIDADPTTGKIDLSKTDEQTSALIPGSNSWDLILEDNTGERIGPLFAGSCYIQELITEPA